MFDFKFRRPPGRGVAPSFHSEFVLRSISPEKIWIDLRGCIEVYELFKNPREISMLENLALYLLLSQSLKNFLESSRKYYRNLYSISNVKRIKTLKLI